MLSGYFLLYFVFGATFSFFYNILFYHYNSWSLLGSFYSLLIAKPWILIGEAFFWSAYCALCIEATSHKKGSFYWKPVLLYFPPFLFLAVFWTKVRILKTPLLFSDGVSLMENVDLFLKYFISKEGLTSIIGSCFFIGLWALVFFIESRVLIPKQKSNRRLVASAINLVAIFYIYFQIQNPVEIKQDVIQPTFESGVLGTLLGSMHSKPLTRPSHFAYKDSVKLINVLETPQNNKFIFGVSVAAHGPYDSAFADREITVSNEISDKESYENYLNKLHKSDNDFAQLAKFLEQKKRTVVIIFGDHWPKAADSIKDLYRGASPQNVAAKTSEQNIFLTPAWFWKSPDLEGLELKLNPISGAFCLRRAITHSFLAKESDLSLALGRFCEKNPLYHKSFENELHGFSNSEVLNLSYDFLHSKLGFRKKLSKKGL